MAARTSIPFDASSRSCASYMQLISTGSSLIVKRGSPTLSKKCSAVLDKSSMESTGLASFSDWKEPAEETEGLKVDRGRNVVLYSPKSFDGLCLVIGLMWSPTFLWPAFVLRRLLFINSYTSGWLLVTLPVSHNYIVEHLNQTAPSFNIFKQKLKSLPSKTFLPRWSINQLSFINQWSFIFKARVS